MKKSVEPGQDPIIYVNFSYFDLKYKGELIGIPKWNKYVIENYVIILLVLI